MALGADFVAKSYLDFSRVKVGVPYIDCKHRINQFIFSTWQGDWNGAIANFFILPSQSWEIGRPPTGNAGRVKLSCVAHASVIHI